MRNPVSAGFIVLASAFVTAVLSALPAHAADRTLKDLMKKMGAQVTAGDAKALAPIFAQTRTMGRPEYPKWASLTEQGEAAAAKGDLAGAKATCKSCHDAYRNDYKTKYGSKAP